MMHIAYNRLHGPGLGAYPQVFTLLGWVPKALLGAFYESAQLHCANYKFIVCATIYKSLRIL